MLQCVCFDNYKRVAAKCTPKTNGQSEQEVGREAELLRRVGVPFGDKVEPVGPTTMM